MCFSRNCLSQQCFTGSGRAYQKCTLRELCTDLCIFARIVQKVYHLLQGFLGFIFTRHILEGNTCFFLDIYFGIRLADTAHHSAARHLAEQEAEQYPKNHDRQDIGQQDR